MKLKRNFCWQIFALILPFSHLWAEGTKQVAPNAPGNPSDTLVMLEINNPDFGSFAAFDGPDQSRLYFRINNATELVYLGLSAAFDQFGLEIFPNSTASYTFRIKRLNPNGIDPVVHGPFTITKDNANVSNYASASYPNYNVNITSNNQLIYRFNPSEAGDYYIEFQRIEQNVNDPVFPNRLFIPYWDISVVSSAGSEIPGRLFSQNWAFRTPTITGDSFPECGWDREFHGTVYTYTDDGFVTQLDFSNSGFLGLSFNVAINSKGPGTTGNLIIDRRSLPGNVTQNASEFRIFLSPPCEVCFPSGICAEITSTGSFIPNPSGNGFCLEVASTAPGQLEVVLDFNKNGIFDPGTQDVILFYDFPIDSFQNNQSITACVPWNGLKGDGSGIVYKDTMQVILTFQQGLQHYSSYDVEFVKNGFCVETFRPLNCSPLPNNLLYWDDSNLTAVTNSGTGQPISNINGCPCQTNNCRTWITFDPNITTPENDCTTDDATTLGYGDKNTLNTWWIASLKRTFIPNVPLHTCEVTAPSEFICQGQSTILTANVSTPFPNTLTYQWSGPAGYTGSNMATSGSVSLPGTYSVTITDGDGRVTTCSFTLIVLPAPTINCIATPVSCNGQNNGRINATASGGFGSGYQFSINGINFFNSGVFENLAPGTYTITVRDGQGCINTCTSVVTQPNPLAVTLVSFNAPTCSNLNNGRATINVTGGTPAYSYLWSNGSTVQNPQNLPGGISSVTVTDANGCTATLSLQLAQPPSLTFFTQTIKPVTCFGGNDGSSSALAIGGTPPFTYLWDNGETASTATTLTAGIHRVTVTDFNGCTAIATDTIDGPPSALSCFVVQLEPASYPGQSDGAASAFPTGGWSGYTYQWSNGSVLKQSNNLREGLVTVTVTDAFGCQTICSIIIQAVDPITCDVFQSKPISCFGAADGEASVEAIGGNGGYTYLWSNGNTGPVATNLSGNIVYRVTITDAKGFSEVCSISLEQPQQAPCDMTVLRNVSCNGNNDGSARVNVNPAEGPFTFLWDNGDTRQTADTLRGGIRTVRITNGQGCVSICSVNITQPPIRLTCPPNLNLECNNPANEGLIEAWLTATSVTGACEQQVILNNYNPANFSVSGCEFSQLVSFFTRNNAGLTTASCFTRIFITDNQPPTIICPPDVEISCNNPLPPKDFAGGSFSDNCNLFFPSNLFQGDEAIKPSICDELKDNCVTFYFLGKNEIGSNLVELRFEINNQCNTAVNYVSFQLPGHTSATFPTDKSIVKGKLGDYAVENPNSPFLHFLRFTAQGTFFTKSKSDIFSFIIPRDKVQDEMVVLVRTPVSYHYAKLTTRCENFKTFNPQVGTNGILVKWLKDSVNIATGCNSDPIVYTRTYQATDACGNVSSPCVQRIFRETDVNPPVIIHDYPGLRDVNHLDTVFISCPLTGPPFPENAVYATDGCTTPTMVFSEVVLDEAGSDCNTKGYKTLMLCRWVATDECLLQSEYTFYMAIVDNEPPQFSPIPNPQVFANCQNIPPVPVLTVTDNCSSVQSTFSETLQRPSCSGLRLVRIWSATDACGNTTTVSQVVNLIDNTPPVFSFTDPALRNVENGAQILADCETASRLVVDGSYAIATDDCDPEPEIIKTVQVIGNLEECNIDVVDYRITWTATDLCGNVSVFSITVNIFDNVAPRLINIPQDICTTVLPPVPTNVTATDGCDSSPSITFKETGPVPFAGSSTVTRTWTAEDNCGNKVSQKQIITLNSSLTSIIPAPSGTVVCNTGGNPLNVLAAGGTPPYRYKWTVRQGNATITSATNSSTIFFNAGSGTSLFEAEVTDSRGCTDVVFRFIQCAPTATTTLDQVVKNIHVYPNPASKTGYVQTNLPHGAAFTLSVFNSNGRKITEIPIEQFEGNPIPLPLNDWATGLYTITIHQQNGEYVGFEKLIITHGE
jgi:hypothetical protein